MKKQREWHGKRYLPEYKIWAAMKERCYRKNDKRYHRYGGRGITVYPEWRDSFQAFYDYIGPRPSPKHTLDRINNDGNYEPGNVRWATQEEQANNRSSNFMVTIPSTGQVMNATEASKLLNINESTIRARWKNGLNIEMEVPKRIFSLTYKGEQKTLSELSLISGLDSNTIAKRISKGMSVEDAVDTQLMHGRKYMYRGKMMKISQIASLHEIEDRVLRKYLDKGIDPAEAIAEIKRKYINVIDKETGEIKTLTPRGLQRYIASNK